MIGFPDVPDAGTSICNVRPCVIDPNAERQIDSSSGHRSKIDLVPCAGPNTRSKAAFVSSIRPSASTTKTGSFIDSKMLSSVIPLTTGRLTIRATGSVRPERCRVR